MSAWELVEQVRRRVGAERGTLRKAASLRVALCYPAPYAVGMSSLGFQTIYREIHRHRGAAAERAFLPDRVEDHRRTRVPLFTYESETPLADFPVVAFSISYELELPGMLEMLDLAGIPLLRSERSAQHPVVLAGGPLTSADPLPLAPFVDVIAVGEGEELIRAFLDAALAVPRAALIEHLAALPGFYVPGKSGALPPVARAPDDRLPAGAQIIAQESVLGPMFLVEAERGCSRPCAYCVMRRAAAGGGMRAVAPERVLSLIPDDARSVGLVGAAVTDHPGIKRIVRALVDGGRRVGISSLRADRLDDELVGLLARGGYRTLTTASDGASQRLRDLVGRRTTEEHLLHAARLAHRHGMQRLKLYQMIGLPGETDADIEELIRFTGELARIVRVTLSVSPFVAKRGTPLDGAPFEAVPSLEAKLARLRRSLGKPAELRPASARWAWVEYMLAQGGEAAGLAAMDAWRAGGSFPAWKRAFAARGVVPEARAAAATRT